MAEIRVEPRRRTKVWVWFLVALAAIGGLFYFLFYHNR